MHAMFLEEGIVCLQFPPPHTHPKKKKKKKKKKERKKTDFRTISVWIGTRGGDDTQGFLFEMDW